MRYAPIIPVKCTGQPYATPHSTGGLGDKTHFMFAEFALAWPEYAEYYKSVGNRAFTPSSTVIMDTLIYEGLTDGTQVNTQALRKSLAIVQPTYLIVPDVPGDGRSTVEAYQSLVWDEGVLDASPKTTPIGVIQGKTWQEALQCANLLGQLTNTLAIPTRSPGGIPRSKLLTMLIEDGPFRNHTFHLLGQAQTGFEDDIRCASFPQVMSLDSKKAVSAALQHINLSTLNETVRIVAEVSKELGPEEAPFPDPQAALTIHSADDFFDWDPYPPFTQRPHEEAQRLRDLIKTNIEVISSWLR